MFRRLRQLGKEALLGSRPAAFWRYVEWRHGYLEPELELVPLLCRRDLTSLDIGASDGMYTHHLVRHSRSCIAFEPRPRAAEMLRRGYRGRVLVHELALSDREGTTELRVPRGMHGYSTIETSNRYEGKLADLGSVARLTVQIRRLDDLALGAIGFAKIDVEGHEEAVLRGGARTIASSQPALLIEVEDRHNRGSVARVDALLGGHGYQRFYYRAGRLVSGAPDVEDPTSADYVRNFIFLPEHRIHEVDRLRG